MRGKPRLAGLLVVVVGVVVSETEQVVGEVRRPGLVKELLLGSQLGDVDDISVDCSRDLHLVLFLILPVGVEATIERTIVQKAVIGGWSWCGRMGGSMGGC